MRRIPLCDIIVNNYILEVLTIKILVLGNGFDIDHDLPTYYSDFLKFCNYITNPIENKIESLKDSQKEYITKITPKLQKKFNDLLNENILLNYFNKQVDRQGHYWIDLEREIKTIVNGFKQFEEEVRASNEVYYQLNWDHKITHLIENLNIQWVYSEEIDEFVLEKICEELCDALNSFSKALELYIDLFINNEEILGVSPDIVEFNADKILTFNYSKTYERIYGGVRWDEEVDYVHGIANSENDDVNIILGITTDNNADRNSYVEFEKFFQRITKKTGNKYKEWLEKVHTNNERIEVAFFGHSLDASDSDIIRDFLENEKTRITIFYHSFSSHRQIVANIIEIIGKEKLIKFVSGENPKIIFKQQQRHQNENNAGVYISRDIRDLYRLYLKTDKEIDLLLKKIKDKIVCKELTYFHSQRNTISLFDAFVEKSIFVEYRDDLLEICKLLECEKRYNGAPMFINEKDWWSHGYHGAEPCNMKVSEFINQVNNYNELQFTKNNNNPYLKMKDIKNIDDMEKAVISAVNMKEPSESFWKQLGQAVGFMVENEVFDKALKAIGKKELSMAERVRWEHIVDMHNENVFFHDQMRDYNVYDQD